MIEAPAEVPPTTAPPVVRPVSASPSGVPGEQLAELQLAAAAHEDAGRPVEPATSAAVVGVLRGTRG